MKRWEQIEGIPAFYWLFSWGSLHQHQLRPRQPNSSSLWPRCTSSLEWCSSTHGLPDTHLQHTRRVIYGSAGAQPQTHSIGPGQGRGVGTALPVQGRRCWPEIWMRISPFLSYPFEKAPLCSGEFERLPAANFWSTGTCSIMDREDKVYLILCTLGGLHWHSLKGLEFWSLHIHKVLVFRFNIMYFFFNLK